MATGPIPRGIIKVAEEVGIGIISCDEIEKLEKYKYAIFFHNNPSVFPDIKTSAKVGWWMCDLRKPVCERRRFDAIFLCNKEFTKLYENYFKTSVYYMPQTGLMDEESARTGINWDIIFIGNFNSRYHINRLPILNYLKERFDIKIIGGEKYTVGSSTLYARSPFNLSISPRANSYTSNRTYNILSSCGFCLLFYFPGAEELFENGKHLVWFESPEQAADIINYYYDHPDEYEKIRANGYMLYQKKHTHFHRLINMFDILKGKTNEFYGYLKKEDYK